MTASHRDPLKRWGQKPPLEVDASVGSSQGQDGPTFGSPRAIISQGLPGREHPAPAVLALGKNQPLVLLAASLQHWLPCTTSLWWFRHLCSPDWRGEVVFCWMGWEILVENSTEMVGATRSCWEKRPYCEQPRQVTKGKLRINKSHFILSLSPFLFLVLLRHSVPSIFLLFPHSPFGSQPLCSWLSDLKALIHHISLLFLSLEMNKNLWFSRNRYI